MKKKTDPQPYRRSAKMSWAEYFCSRTRNSYKPTQNTPKSPRTRRKGTSPPSLPTTPPAGINTKTPSLLAKGELHQGTKARPGPPHDLPAWTLTKTPKSREPPRYTFDDGFTPSTTRGYTTTDPTGRVHTENYFTPSTRNNLKQRTTPT